MKIAILGFGLQGESAYAYFSKSPDNEITVCDSDTNIKIPEGAKAKLGDDYLSNLSEFDLIVRSPSVHPSAIVKANSPEILEKVTSNTNIFFEVCPSKNIIGVTGTKGKGTTSSLIAKILESDSKKVHLGGNIGTPPLDMLDQIQPDDWVILELANFQLIDLKHSPTIAVCLMITDEHLDWHQDAPEYIQAKQQLFARQTSEDTAIYYGLDPRSEHVASVGQGHKVPYMKHPGADVIEGSIAIDGQTICPAAEIKLLGRHNLQNVCAAVTVVWQITQNTEAIRNTITTFTGLPHRLEFVREFGGVKYYNDSFGTTPETAIVAIEAFDEPKVLILGGSDKGANYDALAKAVADNVVKEVITIGDTGPAFAAALKNAGFNNILPGGKNMPEIVAQAKNAAATGDIVLLSTGCASFGMFKDYYDRGDQFKNAVKALV